MSTAIGLIGLSLVALGFVLLINPGLMRRMIESAKQGQRLLLVSLFRVALGAFFVYAAPVTGQPAVIRIIGLIMIAAGLIGLLMGRDRLARFATWWTGRSDAANRFWALVAMAFGALLWWAR